MCKFFQVHQILLVETRFEACRQLSKSAYRKKKSIDKFASINDKFLRRNLLHMTNSLYRCKRIPLLPYSPKVDHRRSL